MQNNQNIIIFNKTPSQNSIKCSISIHFYNKIRITINRNLCNFHTNKLKNNI